MATQAERHARWRERNPGNYEAQKTARRRKREWVQGIKVERGCRDCGERDYRLLHFHHRDPETKLFQVSRIDAHGQEALAKEMAKCDVLCRPCHIETHKKMRANA